MLIGDLDGDKKAEIITTVYNGIAILRNTSLPGAISFAAKTNLSLNVTGYHTIGLNDLNGDGKTDIFAGQSDNDSIIVFQNSSTTGALSFSKSYTYTAGSPADGIMSGDLDGDGKPDIGVAHHLLSNTISILKNLASNIIEKPVCSGSSFSIQSTATSTTYQWQQNTGAAFSNVSDNSVLSGTNTATLQFNNIPASYNSYQYRCIAGTLTSSITSLTVTTGAANPTVVIATPAASVCKNTPVTFTATSTNAGTLPVYQWQINGVNAGTNNTVFTTALLANGSQVKCTMTNTPSCGSIVTVSSNTLTITVTEVIPVVAINGVTTVTKDSATLITAAVTNGGTSPVYKWQDSTVIHGWQDITGATGSAISYKPVFTGDKIRCTITSNAGCANPAAANSNTLAFIVNTITAIAPVPGRSHGIRYYPNPVTAQLNIDSLHIAEQWQTLEIITISGKNNGIPINISNQTRLSINVKKLLPGLYIAVLRRKQGEPVYLKFIKL